MLFIFLYERVCVKRYNLFLAILFALFFSGNIWAIIVTHDSIQDVFKYCGNEGKKVLVLFDLDNTLIEPTEEVGSDQWFSGAVIYAKNKKKLQGLDAVRKILPLYYKLQDTVVLKPVEKITVDVIKRLKEKHIVMGLTARSVPLVEQTTERLSKLGFSFSFDTHFFQKKLSVDSACLKNGILFCGNNDKGDALFELLNFLDIHPDRIIFIDDKYANVEKLNNQFQDKKYVNVIGIHYIFLKSKVDSFVLDEKSKQQIEELF